MLGDHFYGTGIESARDVHGRMCDVACWPAYELGNYWHAAYIVIR
jgi:hypothetical protein